MSLQISIGDLIVYESLQANDGRKRTCQVAGINGDWVLDVNAGTYLSNSFRPQDVIIWEHRKRKKG